MEQTDSLENAIRSLITLQEEQVNQLRIMNSRASSGSTPVSFDPSRTTSFSPYSAYAPGGVTAGSPQMSSMFAPSPTTQARFDQANSYLGQANLKGLLFSDKSGMSMQNQDLQRQNFASKTFNAGTSMVGAVGSYGAGFLGQGIVPGVAGVGLGIAGGAIAGAAVSAYFDNGLKQAKQEQNLNQYLFNNSSQYISSDYSNNTKYSGGMTTDERHKTSSYIRNMNSDELLSDTDVQKMLQGFTEGDLLRNTTDQKNFETKFKKLVENTKSGALMLNESYQSIVGLMSDMQKVGIGSNDSNYVMGLGKVTGAATGTSAGSATNNIVSSAAALTQGTSLSTTKAATSKAVSNIIMGEVFSNADINKIPGSNDTNDLNYNYISNNGGVSSVADALDSNNTKGLSNGVYSGMMASAYDYDATTGGFVLNKDKLKKVSSAKSLQDAQDLTQAGKKNMLTWGKEGQLAWQNTTSRYEALNQIDGATQTSIMFGSAGSSVAKANGLGTTDATAIMAVTGDTPDQIRLGMTTAAQIKADGGADAIMNKTALKGFGTSVLASQQAKTAMTIPEMVKKGLLKTEDVLGNGFANTSDWYDSTVESSKLLGDPKKRDTNYSFAKDYAMTDDYVSSLKGSVSTDATKDKAAMDRILKLNGDIQGYSTKNADGSYKSINSGDFAKNGTNETVGKSEEDLRNQQAYIKKNVADLKKSGLRVDNRNGSIDSNTMSQYQHALASDSSTEMDKMITTLKASKQTSGTADMIKNLTQLQAYGSGYSTVSSSLNDVLDTHKSADQYAETIRLTSGIFKDTTVESAKQYEALTSKMSKDQDNIKNETPDQIAAKRVDELNQYTAYLKSNKGNITSSLNQQAGGQFSYLNSISKDGSWSDTDISTLAKTLMTSMQSSDTDKSDTSKSASAAAAASADTAKALDAHAATMTAMTKTLTSEAASMNKVIDKYASK